jgi:very-short-patch-repair endonuclease
MDETALLALAARQHGLAHRKQFDELGVDRASFRNLIERERWVWRSCAVLQLRGTPSTIEQKAMLAVLDLDPKGAALSHQSAAARWGIPGFSVVPLHVTGTRERGRRGGHVGVVHQPRLLLSDHVLMLDGIPTTSPTLTLFGLASVLRWDEQVARAVDNALAMRLTTVARLHDVLKRTARRGRRGVALMRQLIEARADGYQPPASGMERRFDQLAHRAGRWNFVRQVNVGDEYDWLGRVDFVDRERKVIVEVQSDRYHTALLDKQRDRERIAALRAAGWIVIEITEHELWHEPDKVIARLRSNW